MNAPRPRQTFGEGPIDRLLSELVAEVGLDGNDDLIRRLLVTALDMDASDVDRLELKIAAQTLAEIHNGWNVFSPHSGRAKCTVFGSARTDRNHPDFAVANEFGAAIAARDWMIISGAGPGIMTAAIEGAGIENSMGVNIVLPFEQKAAPIIEGDPKLATFRYFFTRKLFFMKESDGFVLLPGGFGTLDETFELLTLIQTGKSRPAPVVMLDHPGSNYWRSLRRFIDEGLGSNGMISDVDTDLFFHTHDPVEAADHVARFYLTYHSVRFVRSRLIIRTTEPLTDAMLQTLNAEFADIVIDGQIEPTETTKAELDTEDHVDLPRIALRFNNRSFGRLHQLINRINEIGPSSTRTTTGFAHDLQLDDPEL